VKGCHAVLSALLVFIPIAARAADDGSGAARELARKTATLAGRGEPVSLAWSNLSSMGFSELAQARSAFEAALREAGCRISDIGPTADARITLSENRTQYLLVEEIRKGEDRQVWIASWKRTGIPSKTPAGITLEHKMIWEQEEPILDVAFPANQMVVLSASKITVYKRQTGTWSPAGSVGLTPQKPFPRDLRGRLRVNGTGVQAYLPGMACNGGVDPAFTMECKPTDEPWVLESGSRAMLLAQFAATRNHFDGRVITQNGVKKSVPPFYSAAAVEEQGKTLWLLALVDGRTQVFDASLDPGAFAGSWGSDIAGTDAHCGSGFQMLATRAGDSTATDAVQAFSIVSRAASPLTPPEELPGPVTALWTSSGSSVMAIVHNLATGRYEAYLITVACGS